MIQVRMCPQCHGARIGYVICGSCYGEGYVQENWQPLLPEQVEHLRRYDAAVLIFDGTCLDGVPDTQINKAPQLFAQGSNNG